MFLVILLFFFTNVYMWHDNATREMNTALSDRMNSQISVSWVSTAEHDGLLNVTNNGGTEVALSRLWIVSNVTQEHVYADLEGHEVWVAAGATTSIEVGYNDTRPLLEVTGSGQNVKVNYDLSDAESFRILTVRGSTAACSYVPFASLKGNITVVLVGAHSDDLPFYFKMECLENETFHETFYLDYRHASWSPPTGLGPGTYFITEEPSSSLTLVGIIGASACDLVYRKATVVVGGGQSYSVAFVYEHE